MTFKKSLLPATLLALMVVTCLARKETALSWPRGGSELMGDPVGSAPAQAGAAGAIAGRVTFEGAKPALEPIDMEKDPVCAAKHKSPAYPQDGAVNPNGTLPNVFVYIKAGAENAGSAPPTQPVILDQRGCTYHPHIFGIMVGQELQVVSSDATTHNIHPMPRQNKEWNRSQPPGAAPLTARFTHPEIMIPVKCNQHPWMRAYIGVTTNRFYAVTSSEGTFSIQGVPPGDYTIEAWTATFGTQERHVTVSAGAPATADFTFKKP
ncbi:MAG TPA: carboxypeptidase regulatory-like domain-containing protein [Terriglobia bacterium]|nr:carboxypeptidase regulatory-like domain-containing protein [Terriglobia bacterium]